MVDIPELKRGVLDSIVNAIGNTPIVRLNNLTKDLEAEVDVKVESFNVDEARNCKADIGRMLNRVF